jgi:crotonobetainyl-CoA:carnitine CoA-transferase CaiB-like acyl-CoA transferase
VAERLKIDYATLRGIKPDLVYTHAPAYGTHGPKAEMGGYDQLFQAIGGLEYMNGGEGNPPIWVRFGCVDHGDALLSAVGTILALYHRERTGEGQFVDTSLLNAGLWYNADAFVTDRAGVRRRPSVDRHQTGLGADYRLYETREGWLCVAALFDEEWRRFCEVAGKPELARDARYHTHHDRVDHRDALGEILEPVFRTRTAEDWFARLDAAGVPCEVANEGYWRRFLTDPEALEAGRVVAYYQEDLAGILHQFGRTIRFSETPQVIQGPPPALGAHTRQILTELGYDEAAQRELQAKGVILDPWKRD